MPRLPDGRVDELPVEFDVTAGEYAVLWLSNLIRVVLTLGLYWPWAQVRTQRFFLRRTRVGGGHFDYHAAASNVGLRHALATALIVGSGAAFKGSPLLGLVALSIALMAMPALVHTSLTHRAAHTSWAGRRLAFEAPVGAVYAALALPLGGLMGLVWLGAAARAFGHPAWWAALGFAAAVWLLGVPLFCWVYLHERQRRWRLGPVGLRWKGSGVAVASLWTGAVARALLLAVLLGGLGAAGLGVWLWWKGPVPWWLLWPAAALLGAVFLVGVLPYVQARMQNLVWNKTGHRRLRFRSRLKVGDYMALQWRHALLLTLTAGLYWPWAVVASRRARITALTVRARVDGETFKAHWPATSLPARRARWAAVGLSTGETPQARGVLGSAGPST